MIISKNWGSFFIQCTTYFTGDARTEIYPSSRTGGWDVSGIKHRATRRHIDKLTGVLIIRATDNRRGPSISRLCALAVHVYKPRRKQDSRVTGTREVLVGPGTPWRERGMSGGDVSERYLEICIGAAGPVTLKISIKQIYPRTGRRAVDRLSRGALARTRLPRLFDRLVLN